MNFLKELYESYKMAEVRNLIDMFDDDFQEKYPKEPTILPIYHSNKRTGKEDCLEITLNLKGEFKEAKFIEENSYLIFPVTEKSFARTSGAAAHPLSDNGEYVIKGLVDKKYDSYIDELKEWCKNSPEVLELNSILKYITSGTIENDLKNSKNLFFNVLSYKSGIIEYEEIDKKAVKKKLDLKKVFITFNILYNDNLEQNVTKNKELHQEYINYQNKIFSTRETRFCVVQNKNMYCTDTHRGLLGNAKLVSISNNKEPYKGRFYDGSMVTSIGYETSFKIHNILKFLLENKTTRRQIAEGTYLITWLSNDLVNEEKINLMDEIVEIDDDFYDDDEKQEQFKSPYLELIKQTILGVGNKKIENTKVYIAILEKISNGRISLKYFRILEKSELYKNVALWYERTAYPVYNYTKRKWELKTYALNTFAKFIYGREILGKLDIKNESMKKKVTERLLPCVIEGRSIPESFIRQLVNNVFSRRSYERNNWLALIKATIMLKNGKKYKGVKNMEEIVRGLNRNYTDTSYLYGRLLAIMEIVERETYTEDEKKKRTTNAERLFSNYINSPRNTKLILEKKLMVYWDKLKGNPGLHRYLAKEKNEIVSKMIAGEKIGRLTSEFIDGYDQQIANFYTKKEDKEGEK